MTKDEALKLALEALEGVLDDAPKVLDASIAGGLYEVVQCRDAITAIKEALVNDALDKKAENARELGLDYEPVAHMNQNGVVRKVGYEWGPNNTFTALYATPSQRTWVSLTEDEISLIVAECSLVSPSDHYFAEAIEAKLRSKNT